MVNLNPITAWRRLLALPNENRTKTVVMAFLVSAICALLVSGATVILRPIQSANRAAEQQARLENLIAGIPGMSDMLAQDGGALSTVVIDLNEGAVAAKVTPATLTTTLEDSNNWTGLTAAQDTAGLGQRPNFAQVYFLRGADGNLTLALLPISGIGYGGPIDAILALRADMNTIAGLAITQQSETPGLGARIEEPAWLGQFRGKSVVDASGTMRFAVAKGAASSEFEVDGITGATRTSNAITRTVRFWLGDDGYGPLLTAIQRGEF
jgi:Na+-transporting NADH:ubiquinone oxidoreductase subunit C